MHREASAEKRRAPVFDAEDDEDLSHGQHMIAGAMAGIAEHICMFPVDTVKTRMQAYVGARDFGGSASVTTALRRIVAADGVLVLWRGMGAVAVSAGPAHALYFSVYEASKDRFGGNRPGHQPIAVGAAGALATVASEAVMTPLDVVKQRMQLMNNQEGLWAVIRRVYRDEGLGAFFKSYKTTLCMNVPYTAIQFSVYESAKLAILNTRGIDESDFSVVNHIAAGAIAGATAGAFTNPLDVVKTRLQTQGEVGARRYLGMKHALQVIYSEEGWMGLLRGIRARVYFHAPAAAICWTTYEFTKRFLFTTIRGERTEAVLD